MGYLYIEPTLRSYGLIEDDRPAKFTERHHFRLPIASLKASDRLDRTIDAHADSGVIIGISNGIPNRGQLRIVRHALRRRRHAFLYWPAENAIEVIDRERLSSLWRHWLVYNAWLMQSRVVRRFSRTVPGLLSTPVATGSSPAAVAQQTIGLLREPLTFAAADFQSTKPHMLSGIAEFRRLGGVIGIIDDQQRDFPEQLAQHDAPPALQAMVRHLAQDIADVRKSMEALQPQLAGGEEALNRIGEHFDHLQRASQIQDAEPAVVPDRSSRRRLFASKQEKPASTAAAVPDAEAAASLSNAPEQVVVALRATLDQAASDFETANTSTGNEITELRWVREAIGRIVDGLKEVPARLENFELPEAVQSGLQRTAQDLNIVRQALQSLQTHMDGGETALTRAGTNLHHLRRLVQPSASAPVAVTGKLAEVADAYQRQVEAFRGAVSPVPFQLAARPTHDSPIPGTGIYIRTDYWARLVSGGSYGHTCYVAKELSAVTQQFNCLMASNFALLGELGIPQDVIQPPFTHASETDLLNANQFYYEALRARLEALRPAYVFERLVLGNFAMARLSRELGIPYIIEYNGSELSMRRSFDNTPYENEALFLQAEELAFKQATAITVISEHVRADVISRGVDPDKVLTNPNGVDCDEYAPPSAEERKEIRDSLGLRDEPVIGFIGTFGGWHGIDVLAAALPKICRRAPEAKFLLIGDGNLKHLVLDAIKGNTLEARVVDVGRTEQRVGARLLKAADIFVSPHSSHMVDSPFFGSPTKLFEYMALGRGIVASDLEQLGIVMSPALRPSDFGSGPVRVRDQRGVLCKPGDVDEFVAGVLALVGNPEVAAALGRNARAAALAHYSWQQHVARLWDHVVAVNRKSG